MQQSAGSRSGVSRILGHPGVGLVFRLIVGLVFVYASLDKIAHPAEFARIVNNYRILPIETINLVAILLPWIELLAGLFLIFGLFTRGGSLAISVMLVFFVIALTFNVARGLNINCGCFTTGSEGTRIGWSKIGQNVVLLALSLHVLFRGPGSASLGALIGRRCL